MTGKMLTDKQYQEYMKKFSDKYSLVKQEDGIWEILCYSRNTICSYDVDRKLLLFASFSSKTARGQNVLLKKLKESGLYWQINQLGSGELTLIFREQDLGKFEPIFKIIKRRKISKKQRQILRERINKFNRGKDDT
ncbi:MAG: hypothetical protein ABH849_00605 [Nanoarchaeota archaeon]